MKKRILVFLLIILAGIGGFYAWFKLSPNKDVNAFYLIPKDAIYIVETNEPIANWGKFTKSDVWKFLKNQDYFSEIGKNADYLDSIISGQQTLFNIFGSRSVFISAHKTKAKDYDFLFLVDLEKTVKMGFIEETLETLLKSSGFSVTKRDYKNKTIIQAIDKSTKESLYFSVVQNFLLCSYTTQLVENSIMELDDPQLGRNQNFLDIYKETAEDGLCKLYVNYNYIDEYMQCYSDQPDPMITDMSKIMLHSGMKIDVDDEYMQMEGNTNINDSTESYLKALMLSGKSETSIPEILPARTAMFTNLGFESFDLFYQNLVNVLQTNEKVFKEFENNKHQIEKILKIDLQRDMLSWIGNQVAYVQNEPSSITEHTEDLIVVLKANNISLAKEKLDFIAEQVKKRTPAKFKKVDYKDYSIRYLEIKGFFKLFFGKMFSKLEKPYYTIVNDYVVFSNNPRSIISLIEDYENKNTLSENEAYNQFANDFKRESTIFTYIATQKMLPLMYKKLDHSSKQSVSKNEVYFQSFPEIGFQLAEKENMFFTKAKLNFKEYVKDTTKSDIDTTEELDASTMLDSLDDAEKFLLEKFEHNVIKDYYNGTDLVRFEAETKKGELHGRYREFYETGELKLRGRYNKGKKRGVWKYFNKDGTIDKKENFGYGLFGRKEEETESNEP